MPWDIAKKKVQMNMLSKMCVIILVILPFLKKKKNIFNHFNNYEGAFCKYDYP